MSRVGSYTLWPSGRQAGREGGREGRRKGPSATDACRCCHRGGGGGGGGDGGGLDFVLGSSVS